MKEGDKIICPECTEETPQEELDIFGGWCERCTEEKNEEENN